MAFRFVVFVIVSAGILFVSWPSLPRAHGFLRFYALESILTLILFNLEYWFRDPFSAPQIVSWSLLSLSLLLVVHSFRLLRIAGKPRDKIESTTALVQVGVYKYIRHPLYSALLWLGWGVFFKRPSLVGGVLVLAASAALFATAKVEEAQNLRRFGSAYEVYVKATKMFIPFLF
ncbi:MAG: methyltransferase [Anaerolineae bacterium]|jgi:protein-S-isoprenylcysteine O-methyltransferase Ste14